MATSPPQLDETYRAAKRARLPLPPKKKVVRRKVVRVRNAWRYGRRVRHRAKINIRTTTNYVGGEYRCIQCKKWVLNRQAEEHNWGHAVENGNVPKDIQMPPLQFTQDKRRLAKLIRKGKAPKQTRTKGSSVVAQGGAKTPSSAPVLHSVPVQPAAAVTTTPTDAKPSRWRRNRQQPSAAPTTPAVPATTTGGTPMAVRSPRKTAQVKSPNGSSSNGSSGGGGGSVAPTGLALGVLRAIEAWAAYQWTDVDDLKLHLLGMDAALGIAANHVHGFAASQLVGRKVHPGVALPVDSAADELGSTRHRFTEAYVAFERIYEPALTYARSNIPKPDPKIFDQVS